MLVIPKRPLHCCRMVISAATQRLAKCRSMPWLGLLQRRLRVVIEVGCRVESRSYGPLVWAHIDRNPDKPSYKPPLKHGPILQIP